MTENEALREIEAIGKKGIVISVAYGPMGGKFGGQCRWSVNCLDNKTKESFFKPFAADTFVHCVEIAIAEIERHGWSG